MLLSNGSGTRDVATQTTKDVSCQVDADLSGGESDREMVCDFVDRRPVRRNCRLCGKRRADIRIKEELWDSLQEVRLPSYVIINKDIIYSDLLLFKYY